jgi:hypothetical protein
MSNSFQFFSKLQRVHARLYIQTYLVHEYTQYAVSLHTLCKEGQNTPHGRQGTMYANNFLTVIYGHRPGSSFALFLMACIFATRWH